MTDAGAVHDSSTSLGRRVRVCVLGAEHWLDSAMPHAVSLT